MEYCGMWEWRDWEDNTTIFVHEWVRVTFREPWVFVFETYTFGLYRMCLPLPKTNLYDSINTTLKDLPEQPFGKDDIY